MRRSVFAISAVVMVVAGLFIANPAGGDTQICNPFGSTSIQGGRYIVQNNRWGASTPQCITVTDPGFIIDSAEHNNPTNGAPASYPSVYLGCHYDNCTAGSNLPMRVGDISSATSSISYSYTGGTYNAAYDIWLDPTPRTTGQNGTEIMIWFNRQGPIQPIGSPVGTTNIGGRTWEVWSGNIGWNVISYVAPSAITSWDFSVLDFIEDVRARGAVTDDWYLTSIQAGFEPWVGGAGLVVEAFSAEVNGGGAPPTTTPPTTTPPTTTPPTTTPPVGVACAVWYAPETWNNGFVTHITVTNTGTTAVQGWELAFTLPEGQTIQSSWSSVLRTDGSSVTASNLSWNERIAPGGSVEFGFQAGHDGTYSSPTSFRLNGTACTT